MIIICSSAYDDNHKNQIIENVQSLIYNQRAHCFEIHGPEVRASIPLESLCTFATYDHWPEIPEGVPNDGNL